MPHLKALKAIVRLISCRIIILMLMINRVMMKLTAKMMVSVKWRIMTRTRMKAIRAMPTRAKLIKVMLVILTMMMRMMMKTSVMMSDQESKAQNLQSPIICPIICKCSSNSKDYNDLNVGICHSAQVNQQSNW